MNHSTKILIVDDHTVVQQGIRSALEGHPEVEVVGVAGDGTEAIEKTKTLGPKLVIMDISMPGMDGVEATRAIRKASKNVRIIAFTMHSDKEHVLSLFREGVAGYVLKDRPLDRLISAIEAVRRGATYYCGPVQKIIHDYVEGLEEELEGSSARGRFESLSKREKEVFQLLADGIGIKEVADKLCISSKTVESHKYNIMEKLGADSLADLTKIAIRKRLIEP